jgi:hypothetical protein
MARSTTSNAPLGKVCERRRRVVEIGAAMRDISEAQERCLGRDAADGVADRQFGVAEGRRHDRQYASGQRRRGPEEHSARQRLAHPGAIRDPIGLLRQTRARQQDDEAGEHERTSHGSEAAVRSSSTRLYPAASDGLASRAICSRRCGQPQPLRCGLVDDAAKRCIELRQLQSPRVEQASGALVVAHARGDIVSFLAGKLTVDEGADVRGRDDDELDRFGHGPGYYAAVRHMARGAG